MLGIPVAPYNNWDFENAKGFREYLKQALFGSLARPRPVVFVLTKSTVRDGVAYYHHTATNRDYYAVSFDLFQFLENGTRKQFNKNMAELVELRLTDSPANRVRIIFKDPPFAVGPEVEAVTMDLSRLESVELLLKDIADDS